MADDALQHIAIHVPVGIGLLLSGLANACLPFIGLSRRMLVNGLAMVPSLGLLYTVVDENLVATLLLASGIMLLPMFIAIGRRLAIVQKVLAKFQHPVAAWSLVGVVGGGVIIVSTLRYNQQTEIEASDLISGIAYATYTPERQFLDNPSITTDRGQVIPISISAENRSPLELQQMEAETLKLTRGGSNLIRLSPPNLNSNCHGWVFTDGRYIIGGKLVDAILDENGYEAVPFPKPGDVVVYRKNGEVTHTAIVRVVTPNLPIMVESKWGWMGTYFHIVDQSCYGSEYKIYRSPRGSNLLRGIDPRESPVDSRTASN